MYCKSAKMTNEWLWPQEQEVVAVPCHGSCVTTGIQVRPLFAVTELQLFTATCQAHRLRTTHNQKTDFKQSINLRKCQRHILPNEDTGLLNEIGAF